MSTAFGWHFGYVNIRALNREDSVLYFPPEAFGSFRVLHQIGVGTLGPVFRAYEAGRDRLAAIKVFLLYLTPEQAAVLIREFEALIARNINHSGIAAPIAAGLEGNAVYLAQEYAVGDSLDVVLRERGPLPVKDAAQIIEMLADAIDAAASRGVYHGSLHPRDIILSADVARITGFGIVDALSHLGPAFDTYAAQHRAPYSLPDNPSDVYSLGAIAFEMISGRRVSAANLEEFGSEQGQQLRNAFSSALAADPTRRPAQARELALAVRAAVGPASPTFDRFADLLEIESSAPPPFPPSWTAQPPKPFQVEPPVEDRRGWRGAVVLLVTVILAVLAAGYFTTRRSEQQRSQTQDVEPAVAETVVDLPASPPTPPPASTGLMPGSTSGAPAVPPTPSRLASGAAARSNAAPATGNLLIRSSPPGADVHVNGRERGKTPASLRGLPLGSYTIRIARAGYAATERQVQLTSGRSTASMNITLQPTPAQGAGAPLSSTSGGGIAVQSRPAGARVFVNDRLIGSTPLAMPGIPAGPATVRIEMDGYQTWTTTVRVNAGEQTRVGASLDRK